MKEYVLGLCPQPRLRGTEFEARSQWARRVSRFSVDRLLLGAAEEASLTGVSCHAGHDRRHDVAHPAEPSRSARAATEAAQPLRHAAVATGANDVTEVTPPRANG